MTPIDQTMTVVPPQSDMALQRKTSLSSLSQYVNPGMSEKARLVAAVHENAAIGPGGKGDTYKTVMCQTWLETAQCGFMDKCKFAHGQHELRVTGHPMPINRKYKTRLCEKYTVRGICPYGARCLFIHPDPSEPMSMPGQHQYMNPYMYGGGAPYSQQMSGPPQYGNAWMYGNRYYQTPHDRAGPMFVNPAANFHGNNYNYRPRPMPNVYRYQQKTYPDAYHFTPSVPSSVSQQTPSPPSPLQEVNVIEQRRVPTEKTAQPTAEQKTQPPQRRPSQNLLPEMMEELRLEKQAEKRVERREECKRKISQLLDSPRPPTKGVAVKQESKGQHADEEEDTPEPAAPHDKSIDYGQKETLVSTLASVLDYSAGSGAFNASR